MNPVITGGQRFCAIHEKTSMKTEIAATVRSFNIDIAEAVLVDLDRRLADTRWVTPLLSKGWDHGINPGYLEDFIAYWRDTFDWRAQEKKLNGFKHFMAGIEDYQIHFVHEKGSGGHSVPLLLLHGWPDSFYRF